MTWSEERRQAQSERMKARMRRVGDEEVFVMETRGKTRTTQTAHGPAGETIDLERVKPEEVLRVGGAIVTAVEPDMIKLYKRGNWGWYPVNIPANNLALVLGPEGGGNYARSCPECGGYCQEDGEPCPTRGEAPYRRCPVCQKKIPDTPMPEGEQPATTDAEIVDDDYMVMTPERRTKAKLETHMFYYHPSEKSAMMPPTARNPQDAGPPGRMDEIS